MNTNSAMRTVLAAAAAGALVLGSAGAATAAPKSPKAKGKPAGDVTITKVDIRKHKKISLDDPYGALKLRVKVRDTSSTVDGAVEGVTLALFDSKRGGEAIVGSEITAVADGMTSRGKNKKWITYKFVVPVETLKSLDDVVAAGTDGYKGYLCISGVGSDITKWNKQTQRRLNTDPTKKTRRECVKVYDMVDEAPVPAPSA